MFLLVFGRLDGHQHGVYIQISIKLGKKCLTISCLRGDSWFGLLPTWFHSNSNNKTIDPPKIFLLRCIRVAEYKYSNKVLLPIGSWFSGIPRLNFLTFAWRDIYIMAKWTAMLVKKVTYFGKFAYLKSFCIRKKLLWRFWVPGEINSRFWSKTQWQMFLMWSIYEIIHIWTAVVDKSEEWSSQ